MKYKVTADNVENLEQGQTIDSADFSPKEIERLTIVGAIVKQTPTKKEETE
jgi:hypothetical protein